MGPSSAGAVGWMQFMPDTWLRWGVDANGDGVADPWNADDAIYAAARYLAASGGATDIRSAVFSYNHADWYVNEVMALADVYAGGTIPDASFGLAQVDLGAAAGQAGSCTRGARATRRPPSGSSRRRSPARRHGSGTTALLSDRLMAQKRLTIAGFRYDQAQARHAAARAAGRLGAGQTLSRARAASFVQPTQLFGSLPSVTDSSFDLPALSFSAGTGERAGRRTRSNFALAQLGTPYRWGGEGPDAFDCSGLVQAAYASAGVALPRVAQQQFERGPVAPARRAAAAPVTSCSSATTPAHVEHVGMVAGARPDGRRAVHRRRRPLRRYERESYLGATRPSATQGPQDAAAPTSTRSPPAPPARCSPSSPTSSSPPAGWGAALHQKPLRPGDSPAERER